MVQKKTAYFFFVGSNISIFHSDKYQCVHNILQVGSTGRIINLVEVSEFVTSSDKNKLFFFFLAEE